MKIYQNVGKLIPKEVYSPSMNVYRLFDILSTLERTYVLSGHTYSSSAVIIKKSSGPEVIKLFSCSAQLSIKFKLLINTKIAQVY